ncbi:MAG: hypothetical protein HW416_1613 [Chloroflexi bacterium]|nr:hypothetical protein [Chloroflexota bacterium]
MDVRAGLEAGGPSPLGDSVPASNHSGSLGALGDRRRPRILVADDDTAIREVLTVALELEGYEVSAARDGMAALDVVESFAPDVIVVDMQMPIMGGRDFAEAYHSRPGPHAPIIALTGSCDPKTSAEEVGAYAFMPKPFELNDLLAIVTQIVGNHDARHPSHFKDEQ